MRMEKGTSGGSGVSLMSEEVHFLVNIRDVGNLGRWHEQEYHHARADSKAPEANECFNTFPPPRRAVRRCSVSSEAAEGGVQPCVQGAQRPDTGQETQRGGADHYRKRTRAEPRCVLLH
ncbi:hypothetical protein SKAU_G00039930 [Synaphobranchus kaupii]|uniref:Uncharacterized protein n=1 Tax=Synaphobranchus kaupii TaxID=118154 RepID=A0A9Q1GHB6_SYNKA|nr:hypothetical protein SKAU_G00039930 [Synaphobranchus kaupii]